MQVDALIVVTSVMLLVLDTVDLKAIKVSCGGPVDW